MYIAILVWKRTISLPVFPLPTLLHKKHLNRLLRLRIFRKIGAGLQRVPELLRVQFLTQADNTDKPSGLANTVEFCCVKDVSYHFASLKALQKSLYCTAEYAVWSLFGGLPLHFGHNVHSHVSSATITGGWTRGSTGLIFFCQGAHHGIEVWQLENSGDLNGKNRHRVSNIRKVHTSGLAHGPGLCRAWQGASGVWIAGGGCHWDSDFQCVDDLLIL